MLYWVLGIRSESDNDCPRSFMKLFTCDYDAFQVLDACIVEFFVNSYSGNSDFWLNFFVCSGPKFSTSATQYQYFFQPPTRINKRFTSATVDTLIIYIRSGSSNRYINRWSPLNRRRNFGQPYFFQHCSSMRRNEDKVNRQFTGNRQTVA